jgi:tetraacyldisaccharide-1-P 4'-kinase
VVVVSDGRDVLVPARESGDEPQMLARALPGVPVLVSADRHLAGRLAERRFACTVHLLDDGFQHVQLARDINLLVMAKMDLDERLLPWGRLREPLEAATAADAVLVSGTEEDATVMSSRLGVARVFRLVPRYDAPIRGRAQAPTVATRCGCRRNCASERFAALRAQGWDVARGSCSDHHWFSPRDVRQSSAAIETKGTLS